MDFKRAESDISSTVSVFESITLLLISRRQALTGILKIKSKINIISYDETQRQAVDDSELAGMVRWVLFINIGEEYLKNPFQISSDNAFLGDNSP